MGRPRKKTISLATQIQWILMDSPRPLFLGEIAEAINSQSEFSFYEKSVITSTLSWLVKRGVIGFDVATRDDVSRRGRKQAKAYWFNHPDDLLYASKS